MAAARALRSPAPQPCARTRADAKRSTKARASPIEDMRALLKKVTAPQPAATASVAAKGQAFADTAPSWDAIQSAADAVLEKNNLKAEWDFETGEPSAYAKRRTFPKDGKLAHTDTPHRVSFFRDHASWCPYSQKCWLLLEEKGVSYDLTKINMRCYGDKPASFLRLNPSGTLPAAVIDGKSLTDSSDIVRVLEAVFPEKPMLPPEGTRARALADQLLWLERGVFSAWMRHVTSAWADEENRKGVELALMAVEDALASTAGPYFLGSPAEGAGEDTASPNDDGFSYVDIAFAPFLERLAASELYFKGLAIRQPPGPKRAYPYLNAWFDAMEARPAYYATRGDFYSTAHDLPPQLGGCAEASAGADARTAIDGGEWTREVASGAMPSIEYVNAPPELANAPPEAHAALAAARVARNAEAVARFAARGALARGGPKPVSAPLSDPSASALVEADAAAAADAAIRRAVARLLPSIPSAENGDGAKHDAVVAAQALEYLQKRVGVPRDMPLDAARWLRAALGEEYREM